MIVGHKDVGDWTRKIPYWWRSSTEISDWLSIARENSKPRNSQSETALNGSVQSYGISMECFGSSLGRLSNGKERSVMKIWPNKGSKARCCCCCCCCWVCEKKCVYPTYFLWESYTQMLIQLNGNLNWRNTACCKDLSWQTIAQCARECWV